VRAISRARVFVLHRLGAFLLRGDPPGDSRRSACGRILYSSTFCEQSRIWPARHTANVVNGVEWPAAELSHQVPLWHGLGTGTTLAALSSKLKVDLHRPASVAMGQHLIAAEGQLEGADAPLNQS
jgi:hypothetical protein